MHVVISDGRSILILGHVSQLVESKKLMSQGPPDDVPGEARPCRWGKPLQVLGPWVGNEDGDLSRCPLYVVVIAWERMPPTLTFDQQGCLKSVVDSHIMPFSGTAFWIRLEFGKFP